MLIGFTETMPRIRIRKCFHVLVISSGTVALLLVWGVLDSTQNYGSVFPQESQRLWYKPFQGTVKTCEDPENSIRRAGGPDNGF